MKSYRWRTADIVVASVIAVAFGVVFWAWGLLYKAAEPLFAGYAPAQALLYGVWLVPAVLGPWIIRKPGAALYCETVAAIISVLLGSAWGTSIIWQGLVQGLGAELVFLFVLYRVWRMPIAILAGAATGLGAAIWDQIAWYSEYDWMSYRLPVLVITVLSSAVIAGAGSPLLTSALARTGVLDAFPAGRGRELV